MRGVYTALITPFDSRNELDLVSYRKILADQKDAGVSGVIPCGTTGESPTLTLSEKKLLIQTALEALKGSNVKVLAGTGSNNTSESVELSAWASDQGVDGVLVVAPYYNKPSQDGLEAHFRAIADAVKCEVMLYNVPGRTCSTIDPVTITRLAAHPRIRSLKEASADMGLISELLERVSDSGRSLDILSGDDATYLASLSVGSVGVVSVASNLLPRAMVSIQRQMDQGNPREALAIHRRYFPLFRDLFVETNPVPIKMAMELAGFSHSRVRLPLVPMSAAHSRILQASLGRCGVAEGTRQ